MPVSMSLLRENAAQWLALLMNLAALLIFLATAALAAWGLRMEKKGAQAEDIVRLERARKTLEQLLRGSMVGLVTAAEREHGPGTGALKKSAVLAQLLRLLPGQWRGLFDLPALEALIESGLCHAKELWQQPETPAK